MANSRSTYPMGNQELPPEDIRQFEEWVASARDYIIPTDDLRPRVLEAASSVVDSRLQERRIGYAIISVAVVCVFWAGLWLWLTDYRANTVGETADSISRRALEIHDRESVNIHQATVDAYEEWRSRSHRSRLPSTQQGDVQVLHPAGTAEAVFDSP